MKSDTIYSGRKASMMFFFFVAISLLSLASSVSASDIVLNVGVGSQNYDLSENMTVGGFAYEGTTFLTDTYLFLTVVNSTGDTVSQNNISTDAFGTFIFTVPAPSVTGQYNITVSILGTSKTIPITVSGVSYIFTELVEDSIAVSSFGALGSITPDPSMDDVKASNFTYNNTEYSVIVENISGTYDTLYIDDDTNLTFSNQTDTTKPVKYLKAGSSFNLDGKKFTVWYIDPKGNFTIIVEKTKSIFGVSDNTSKLIVLALDVSGDPVANVNISADVIDDEGAVETSNTLLGGTDSDGILQATFNLSSVAGTHNIIFNEGLSLYSYTVELFKLKVAVTNEYGDPIYMISPNETIFMKASLLDISNGLILTGSVITAEAKVSGKGLLEKIILVDNDDGIFINNYTINSSADGKFSVQFKVKYNNYQQVKKVKFEVKNYELFMIPVAGEKGPSEGFAPGENGSLLISGRTLGSGEFINLSNMTDNCNLSMVNLNGIYDKNGVDKFNGGNYTSVNLSGFYTYMVGQNNTVPEFIKKEITKYLGEQACVILFQAPEDDGIYTIESELNISGTIENVYSTLSIQNVFIYTYPVSDDGNYQHAISPGGSVNLIIEAYDALTGQKITSGNITSAEIIEVRAESSDDIVTDDMLNITFNNTFSKASLPAISFVANDSIMGHHFVSFKVTLNVTRSGTEKTIEAIGSGWFQEKLYQVWAYPERDKGSYFNAEDNIDMRVMVTDASGRNSKQDISVSLNKVNTEYGETITPIESVPCTTDEDGSCILKITAPTGGWDSGHYAVSVKIKDTNDVIDYGYGWFEVKMFNFYAYTKQWETPINKSVPFEVILGGSNSSIIANVTIDTVYYEGNEDRWQQPTVVTTNANTTLIDGSGTITLPAEFVQKDGYYSVVFKATYNGSVETSRAWFKTKTFMIFAKTDKNDNWEHSYGTSENVTIVIEAFDDVDWSKSNYNNYSGTGHDLSTAWVYMVQKNGMWDDAYRNENELQTINQMSSSCSSNTCNLTFNLSGFDQGNYDLIIKANGTDSKEAKTWFWMRVEKLKISVPQIIEDYRVSLDTTLSSGKTITIEESCGGEYDMPIEPANVTVCKYARIRMARQGINSNLTDWSEYKDTYYLFDKNASKLYVNTTGSNFTGLSPYSINNTFTDSEGVIWNIMAMSVDDNKISLDCVNCVYGEKTQTNENSGEISISDSVVYLINKSLSKSGTFLTLGNANGYDDYFREQEWLDIDLDNDSSYDSEYIVVIADTEFSGVYDTVILSQTRNFTNAVDSNTGFSGTGDLRFNVTAKPIYLLDIKYTKGASSSSGAASDYYRLQFTSNRPEYSGRYMGVFEAGSTIKLPILVTTPSTGAPIVNATVNVSTLSSNGMYNMETYPANAIAMNTTAFGMAIVELNTTGLESGNYFINIEVKDPTDDEIVTVSDMWQNPQFEIRNFEVRGELGIFGTISDLNELSVDAGTMEILETDEFIYNVTSSFYSINNDLYRADNYRLRSLYYNKTSNLLFNDNSSDDWSIQDGNYTIYNLSDNPNVMIDISTQYGAVNRFTVVSLRWSYNDYTEIVAGTSVIDKDYNFTVHWINNTDINLSIDYFRDQWVENMIDGSKSSSIVSVGDSLIGNMFYVSHINENNGSKSVVINWTQPSISLTSAWSGIFNDSDSNDAVLSKIAGTDLQMIAYNSKFVETAKDKNGWSSHSFDSVKVINLTTNGLEGTYRLGEPIPAISNKAVVKIDWSGIRLSNMTVNENRIYGLPWTCDAEKYYVANFTESSTGFILRDNMNNENMLLSNLSTDPYYMLLFDDECNNIDSTTTALIDDDIVFDTYHAKLNSSCEGNMCYSPWDYDGPETGFTLGWDGNNKSEDWMRVGQMSWPFTVTSFNETEGTAKVFKSIWDYDGSVNLTLWVTVKDFSGVPITGNISLVEIVGFTYGCNGPEENVITNITAEAPIVDGIGYLEMDLTTLASGDYELEFEVTSSYTNKTEILRRHTWIMDKIPNAYPQGSGGSSSGSMSASNSIANPSSDSGSSCSGSIAIPSSSIGGGGSSS